MAEVTAALTAANGVITSGEAGVTEKKT